MSNTANIKEGEVYAYAYFPEVSVEDAIRDNEPLKHQCSFRRVFAFYKDRVFYSKGGDENYDCSIATFNAWIRSNKAKEVRNT